MSGAPPSRPSCSTTPRPSLRLSPQITDLRRARTWLSRTGRIARRRGRQAPRPALPARPSAPCSRSRTSAPPIASSAASATAPAASSSPRCSSASTTATGRLDHVGFTSALANEDKPDLTRRLEALRGDGFTGNAPGGPSRWSTERSGEYFPLRHELVVEVSYDHVTGARFRHGTGLKRWRPDKAPRQCTYDQLHLEARPSAIIARGPGARLSR